MVSGLYENREQIDFPGPVSTNSGVSWDLIYRLSDNKYPAPQIWKWFVSPRMRINAHDANYHKPVIRIEAYAYNGNQILSQIIYSDYFKHKNANNQWVYNGEYREIYYDPVSRNPIEISVTGADLNQSNTALSDCKSSDPESDSVYYRIYWYGQVDVWLDRVRVEDEWSFYLFHPDLDSLQQTPYYFVSKIH